MLFNIPYNLTHSSGIYTITNCHDNRFYIGSTICFKKRFNDHKSHLKNTSHNNKYLRAFVNKYGLESLSFNILYPCKDSCLVYNEKLWIEMLKPQFNIKKIINRPISDDELRHNNEQFLKQVSGFKTPLCFLIEKNGKEWWNNCIKNNTDSLEEINRIETGYYRKQRNNQKQIK